MKRAVILVAPGFEESETLTIADILRRAEISCELAGTMTEVTGSHGITVQCDRLIEKDVIACDMVILPGGYESTAALQKDPLVLEILREMAKKGKYVSAMCAAPLVLKEAGLLKGKKYTAYTAFDNIMDEGTYLEDMVVTDGSLITSRGPATAYAFAYTLVDLLGGDAQKVMDRMVYRNAFQEKEEQ